jgi:exportin-2 (importin alpha re-exporter)
LKEAQRTRDHPLVVLQLIANENAADLNIRQAAAVHFKNTIREGWDVNAENGTDGITISDQDRITIKSHLVQLMCTVPNQIQSQLSESISLIAAVDYPANWYNLLPELVQQMQTPDPKVLIGVLKTANSIFQRFRYVQRNDALYIIIKYTLETIQEPLLALFQTLGQAVEAYANDLVQLKPRMQALRLICRIFFSLNYQDLPEFFEDHMGEWMTGFVRYLQYTNRLLVDVTEEHEPSLIDALQAAIIENLKLYADKDEETFMAYLPNFTTLIWSLLMTTSALPKHDTLATTSMKFLSSLVQKQMHRSLFQDDATLRSIVDKIVIPNLYFRESDEELFEDNPFEYILTEVEGSDNESRRKCSQHFLKSMCRQFETETTLICAEHVARLLQESGWKGKDAAVRRSMYLSFGWVFSLLTRSFLFLYRFNL